LLKRHCFLECFSSVLFRLRAAKVLLIGLDGLGAEIAKNIILAGVNTVTFLDHRNVTELDRCSQFFIPKEDIGKNVNVKQ